MNPKRNLLGSPEIRKRDFFKVWLDSVERCTKPSSIVVIDSHSPVKPPDQLREKVSWIELPFNARHSTDHLGRWSGWTRSVLLAGQFALSVEADYFVYVEQDCLLAGEGIVEYCISQMSGSIMLGSGRGTPKPIQQSFFIVRHDRLSGFLTNLAEIKYLDHDCPPEWKFVCATSRLLTRLTNLGLLRRKPGRVIAHAIAKLSGLQDLPVGSGRARPIPVDQRYYYFQHGSDTEIAAYLGRSADSPGDGFSGQE